VFDSDAIRRTDTMNDIAVEEVHRDDARALEQKCSVVVGEPIANRTLQRTDAGLRGAFIECGRLRWVSQIHTGQLSTQGSEPS